MARIYTLANQKGGVGKTTTAINLGAYLAFYEQRVLLIDLDPQSNATSCLKIDKNTIRGGTYEVLISASPAASFILFNSKLKLSILPSTPGLAGAEIELVNELARETRLKKALAALGDRYDYILVDCPPSLGIADPQRLGCSRGWLDYPGAMRILRPGRSWTACKNNQQGAQRPRPWSHDPWRPADNVRWSH